MNIWVFPKIGVPQNGWFMMENPIKMEDLGVYTIIFKRVFHKKPSILGYPYFRKHSYVGMWTAQYASWRLRIQDWTSRLEKKLWWFFWHPGGGKHHKIYIYIDSKTKYLIHSSVFFLCVPSKGPASLSHFAPVFWVLANLPMFCFFSLGLRLACGRRRPNLPRRRPSRQRWAYRAEGKTESKI